MKASYVIKGGRVIDPSREIDDVRDVVIDNAWIVDANGEDVEVASDANVIDASGCIVTPGLIDHHAHFFYNGSGTTIHADTMLSTGVTAAVDAGTAGPSTYRSFFETVVAPSPMHIKGYLTPWAGGQLDVGINEDFNPDVWNRALIARIIDRYRDNIVGLKIRLSSGIEPEDEARRDLEGIVALAAELNEMLGTSLRVCVHTTDCQLPAGEVASILRPGDVLCHCYQPRKNNLVLADGTLDPGVVEARRRGVIFDAAIGKSNFGIETAMKAFELGFYPDIIATDATIDKFNLPPFTKNLPVVLSKFISLGMSLHDAITAATVTPAAAMGMSGKIGTLAPGAYADVAIFKYRTDATVHHQDITGYKFVGHELLVPQMTFCCGEPVFSYTEFDV